FPRDYEDRSCLKEISMLEDGQVNTFEGLITSKVSEKRIRRGLTIYNVQIEDETGRIIGVWYNQPYIKKVFQIGDRYVFHGKIHKKYRNFEVQNPVYEKLVNDKMRSTMRIIPVYPSTANLSQSVIRSVMSNALEILKGGFEEILPAWIEMKYGLCDINFAMENIHFPGSNEDFDKARYRLVFDELFCLQLGMLSIKNSILEGKDGIRFLAVSEEMRNFINSLGFKLTNAQKKVLAEIEKDMEDSRVMNRLVQGDVGSGKTVIAAAALFKAVKSGYQGALMAPTEILARQHFSSLKALMDKVGITIVLLTGSQTKAQKTEVIDGIRTGKAQIVIGTHAIIEDNIEFFRLGLVVTDEQHRFGVRQRAKLSNKGNNPDVIVMTATPIPRTLSLIIYGDMDISVIDELPPGRKPVETYVVDESMRERINEFIRKKIYEGRQAYIVCPLVEESDAVNAKSAQELAEKIARDDFKDLQVGLIHGKMASKDKEDIMKRFLDGEINILVSTTVIEVGVNVPNSTIMVVENAERFGLAQLHQLRGRVGRGEHQSYCILYNQGKNKVAAERMKVLKKTFDGFLISEKDLELRGPGEFFGTRQHGIPELKIANLYRDMDILKKAQEAASEILIKDGSLIEEENLKLKIKITNDFKEKLEELSMN
ncbi:MAG: ATP-dependent DNA helicase RecG, partial [Clostridiaceae bacterium]|nr:ATP-dependent DNA helicase RecG [Clostridiaceae bacterium]